MALWAQCQRLPPDALQHLQAMYDQKSFPITARHHLSAWIETQRWDDVKPAQATKLYKTVQQLLQNKHNQMTGPDRVVLQDGIQRSMAKITEAFGANNQVMALAVKQCLDEERRIVGHCLNQPSTKQIKKEKPDDIEDGQSESASQHQLVQHLDTLVMYTKSNQDKLSKLQQILEVWLDLHQKKAALEEKLSRPLTPGLQQDLAKQRQDCIKLLDNRTVKLHCERHELVTQMKKVVQMIHMVQGSILNTELNQWKRWQQLACIGAPHPGVNIETLQQWFERLLDIILHSLQQVDKLDKLQQDMLQDGEQKGDLHTFHDQLNTLLNTLVSKSFVVEEQPRHNKQARPQVLKTDGTKFTAALRFLLGKRLCANLTKLPQVNASIYRGPNAGDEVVKANGEKYRYLLHNSKGTLELDSSTSICSVKFKNMNMKQTKIAGPAKRNAEPSRVTDEKAMISFQTELSILGTLAELKTMSLPVVLISHSNQESNAWATILWDNAFSKPDRELFEVPEKAPWMEVGHALSWQYEMQTGRGLTEENMTFLAEKLFGFGLDYSNMTLSWTAFNRDTLPDRKFTFWQWFHGTLDLTTKKLGDMWKDGCIMGFISKLRAQELLLNKCHGTFLLRFSDSSAKGAISAVWVEEHTGDKPVQFLEPYTVDDLAKLPLAERIRDYYKDQEQPLQYLYPDTPRDSVFEKYYTMSDDASDNAPDVKYVKARLVAVTRPTRQQSAAGPMSPGEPFTPMAPSPAPSSHMSDYAGSVASPVSCEFMEQQESNGIGPSEHPDLPSPGPISTIDFDVLSSAMDEQQVIIPPIQLPQQQQQQQPLPQQQQQQQQPPQLPQVPQQQYRYQFQPQPVFNPMQNYENGSEPQGASGTSGRLPAFKTFLSKSLGYRELMRRRTSATAAELFESLDRVTDDDVDDLCQWLLSFDNAMDFKSEPDTDDPRGTKRPKADGTF
ncbi:signal transducer and activator of transcription 5B-like [Branchiostoma floridae]|uniref:Signal transducer and activator of transcription n=1 Tax=Branchiostoma floridae TaxID=7739 RepID=A0A9J7LA36_BRAFL|nr:signal transducer and activator of transcription 5B-like [Branchiostoma floridae]